MFVRAKRIGAYSYLYLVETVRENGKTKQRIIRNLGRKEVVEAAGDLDRLARSAARLSQRSMILSLIEDGSAPDVACRRIGAPLLFERLWQESGCRAVVEGLLAGSSRPSARAFRIAFFTVDLQTPAMAAILARNHAHKPQRWISLGDVGPAPGQVACSQRWPPD